VLVNLITY